MADVIFKLRSNPTALRAIVALLISGGADVTIGSAHGLTPLHIAAVFGCFDIIPVLVAAGAEVGAIFHRLLEDEETREAETPLDSALRFGRVRSYAPLLRAGAELCPFEGRIDDPYLQRVVDAGGWEAEPNGWEAYRRAHVDKLALLFAPKPETGRRSKCSRRPSPLNRLPPELIRRVVEFWAHAGYY